MIQRIQSVWLFLSSFLAGSLFIFPLYHYNIAASATPLLMGAKNEFVLLLLATLLSVVPLVALFMFKNRKLQKRLIVLTLLLAGAFIAMMLQIISSIKKEHPDLSNDNFALPGPIIPIVVMVCLVMAYRGISKDEALIRSADRFR